MEYTITIVGNSGVGKTAYIKKWLTGEWQEEHITTQNTKSYKLSFNTNHGMLTFIIKEHPGGNGAFEQSDAVIVMFDKMCIQSFNDAKELVPAAKSVGMKVVLCGNKADLRGEQVSDTLIASYLKEKLVYYYSISTKANYNFDKPLIYLARELSEHQDLVFIEY